MSKKRKRKQPADRPATRRYVQSMARRLKAELLKAQGAEIAAAIRELTAPASTTKRPDGYTGDGYPWWYTHIDSAPTATIKKRRVSG